MIRSRACLIVTWLVPLAAYAQPTGEGGEGATESSPEPPKPEAAPAESESRPPEPPTPAPQTAPRFKMEPYGYLRLQYIVVQNDPNVAFVGRDDGFELQNARFGVRGRLDDRVRFALSLDGAVDVRAQNSVEGKLGIGMRDAYADVVISGDTAVRAGYFDTWVDPQSLISDTEREFVDEPIESRGMRSTEGWFVRGLPPGRSLGAALRLEPSKDNSPGFELAVQNGADEFASNNDNDKPALSVAAMFKLANSGFLVAAGRWNPRTVGMLPFRQDETDLQGSFGAQVNPGPIVLGAGGMVQRTTFEATNGPVQNAFGAHAQLLVRISASLPVLAGYRFGILDPSDLIVSDRVMEHTVGAVLRVPSLRMRVQLQATHVQEQAARELSNTRVQLAAELAL